MHRTFVALLSVSLMCIFLPLAVIGCGGGGVSTPDRPPALNYYVQAVEAYNAGDTNRAIVLLNEAVRQNPDLRMARAMLGDLQRARGDYAAAIPNYERLVKLDPYSSANHYKLGLSYQLVNRLKEAAASYLRALKLDPKDWRSNMNLGLVYLALEQIDDAVTYLERASVLQSDNAEIWSNLGVALDARGSVVLAEAAYKKALELDPKQDLTLLNLGSNLVLQNKSADALVVMEQAVKKMRTAAARKRYADALALNGKNEAALAEYDAALKQDPKYWPAITEKGFLYIKMYSDGMMLDDTKKQQAISLWQKSLSMYRAQPRVDEALKKWTSGNLFGQ